MKVPAEKALLGLTPSQDCVLRLRATQVNTRWTEMAAKRPSADDAIERTILSLLPADGTPVLNRVMRVMLARNDERAISEEDYFSARDALLKRGLIGRMRGQGGQLFLASPSGPEPTREQTDDLAREGTWPEAKLMAPLRAFLDGPFRTSLDLPSDAACVIQDTSAGGSFRGRWARPDFILVSAMRFRLMPGAQVDLHSFELKTETGGSVLAIHEALAQTRFTHFGHLVWHLPEGSRNATLLGDVVMHCEEHGIGLIRMKDPLRPLDGDGFEVLVDPRRKSTLPSIVDGFLESRLSKAQKEHLKRALKEDL